MAATLIPYAWISTPLSRRPDSPVNAPVVTQQGGVVGYSTNSASVTRYGYGAPQITLLTACTADPGVLATFLTTYRSAPRPRQPIVRINLIGLSDAACLRVLSVGFAQWVQISDAPAGWAPGAANFIIQGLHHVMGVEERYVEWQTSALIGTSPTAPGPWFKWGTSTWGSGTDVRPF